MRKPHRRDLRRARHHVIGERAGKRLTRLVIGYLLVKRGADALRDPALHREVCDRIAAWFAARPGWTVLGITESPILGPEGNREFLIAARRLK